MADGQVPMDPSGRRLGEINTMKGKVAGVEVDELRNVPRHVDPDNEELQVNGR